MSLFDEIRKRASKNLKRIALPESEDERTVEAVKEILENRIAKVLLIGKESAKKKILSTNIKDLEVFDPERYEGTERLASEYYEIRKHKGVTAEEARKVMTQEYVTFGAMLTRNGMADGFVAGASHTTPDVIRTCLRCIPIDRSLGVISGAFLMEFPDTNYGEKGVFVFADCGVNPNPNAEQLAGIALSSANLFSKLVGKVPRVAFLSYSSKGSAKGELVDKIKEALKKVKSVSPGLIADGEFQLDSAIVPEVAKIKCPESEVAGLANVLIFPNLDAGNISYKLAQRLAKARAVGPILLGFTKPASDLSRGCGSADIVDAVAVTAVMTSSQ